MRRLIRTTLFSSLLIAGLIGSGKASAVTVDEVAERYAGLGIEIFSIEVVGEQVAFVIEGVLNGEPVVIFVDIASGEVIVDPDVVAQLMDGVGDTGDDLVQRFEEAVHQLVERAEAAVNQVLRELAEAAEELDSAAGDAAERALTGSKVPLRGFLARWPMPPKM